MGIPQGSEVLNTQVFSAATDQINACVTCANLQNTVNSVFSELNGFIEALIEQNDLLGPMQALLTAPTSPTEAVTWITNFITAYLTPQLAVYAKYAAKVTALAAQITALTSAITTAESRISGCTITVPTLPALPPF